MALRIPGLNLGYEGEVRLWLRVRTDGERQLNLDQMTSPERSNEEIVEEGDRVSVLWAAWTHLSNPSCYQFHALSLKEPSTSHAGVLVG